jgi:hypothetical protein
MTLVHTRIIAKHAVTTAKSVLLLFGSYIIFANGENVQQSTDVYNVAIDQQRQRQVMDDVGVQNVSAGEIGISSTNGRHYQQNINELGETEVYPVDNFDTTYQITTKLWNCQGDCDNDSDCFGTLKCLQRYGNEPVLGCYGYNDNPQYYAYDFCYDPLFTPNRIKDNTMKEYLQLNTITKPADTSSTENLIFDKCQGHCLADDNCIGELKCMIRDNTKYGPNDPVPGCTGLRIHTEYVNYCYHPDDSVGSYYAHPENLSICLYQGS